MEIAVYDTKPYDQEYLQTACEDTPIHLDFHDFRLRASTANTAKGADAVCVFVNDCLDAPCLEALAGSQVKLILLRCAGYNNVDLNTARQLSLPITRVPAYSPHAVAEHAFGLLLCLNRKIHRAFNRVREQNFSLQGLLGFDLFGKTIGILGTGKIGKAAAQIAKGFGTEVLVHDILPDLQWAEANQIRYVDLPFLLRESDILSLHVPLAPNTFHLMNADTIGQMKKGAILINTSRGKVMETPALIQGLKSGHLGGVALDTYEEEEGVFFEDLSNRILMDDELARLLTFPNVLITAHQGFFTHESLSEIARVTIQNALLFSEGKPFLKDTTL